METKYFVKKIEDPAFPWGVFENNKIIARLESHELAIRIMKGFDK